MRSFRFVALLALLPSALLAQGNPRMTGLTAGFNLSRFGGEDVSDVTTDGRVGLAVGVFEAVTEARLRRAGRSVGAR